jgi:hypothetical protein
MLSLTNANEIFFSVLSSFVFLSFYSETLLELCLANAEVLYDGSSEGIIIVFIIIMVVFTSYVVLSPKHR